MYKHYVKINADRLGEIIKDKGLTYVDFSEQMGHSKNWFHNIKKAGCISQGSLKMIETLFGIKPERFVVKDNEPEPKQDENPVMFMIEMLQRIDARLTKLEKAWN